VERWPDLWRSRLGQRVVVRRRLPDGAATDVVGPLVAVDKVSLTVAASAGTVTIPLADVVVGKVVPPRPARKAPPHRALAVADLERVMALHWRAPVAEPLGSWLLRSAEGFTHRANSVLAAGLPGLDLADAVGRARAWYSARSRPALAGVPRPASEAADAAELTIVAEAFAAGAGRVIPQRGAFVLTAAIAAVATARADAPEGLRVRLHPEPDAGWLALYRYRGEPLPPIATTLLLSAPEQVFVSVVDGDRTVAVGRGSLGGGWAGITAVEVSAGYRRRGLARLVLARTASWAAQRGARSMFVQVGETNDAAVRLYESAGFTHHHRYDYLTPNPRG
jgi:ribosomal protein S18 acetylase RimI-like enzyme